MRPVSIAWGGVLALILTGAATAEPLNPQPLPPGHPAPEHQASGRQAAATYVITVCAKPVAKRSGQGRTAAAPHGSGGGAGKTSTACASGKH